MSVALSAQAMADLNELPDSVRESMVAILEDLARRPHELERVSLSLPSDDPDIADLRDQGLLRNASAIRVMGISLSGGKYNNGTRGNIRIYYTLSSDTLGVEHVNLHGDRAPSLR